VSGNKPFEPTFKPGRKAPGVARPLKLLRRTRLRFLAESIWRRHRMLRGRWAWFPLLWRKPVTFPQNLQTIFSLKASFSLRINLSHAPKTEKAVPRPHLSVWKVSIMTLSKRSNGALLKGPSRPEVFPEPLLFEAIWPKTSKKEAVILREVFRESSGRREERIVAQPFFLSLLGTPSPRASLIRSQEKRPLFFKGHPGNKQRTLSERQGLILFEKTRQEVLAEALVEARKDFFFLRWHKEKGPLSASLTQETRDFYQRDSLFPEKASSKDYRLEESRHHWASAVLIHRQVHSKYLPDKGSQREERAELSRQEISGPTSLAFEKARETFSLSPKEIRLLTEALFEPLLERWRKELQRRGYLHVGFP